MVRAFSWALVCGILCITPTAGYGQKKKDGPLPPAVPGTPEEYAKLNDQKEVLGTLITRDSDLGSADATMKRNLSFRYDYEVTDVNPNYKPTKVAKPHDFSKELQQLQAKQAAAMQIPNAQKQAAALQQLGLQQQQLFAKMQQEQAAYFQRLKAAGDNDVRTGNLPYAKFARAKEFVLEIEKDVLVRRLKPALEYDDRGFLKEYSKEELEKLHLVDNKDKKKPGYPAKYEDVLPKQTIAVFLTPGKKVNEAKKEKTDKADKADPDAEPVIPVRPTVRMIVIVEDIPNPNGIGGGDLPPVKKKKKKE